MNSPQTVTVNAREYRLPTRPTLVITVDGCDPRYLDDALERGLMPRFAAMLNDGGAYALGRSQMPSFTNTNNISIVTGSTPAVHGLPGNHYLDPSGEEIQLSDPRFLRAPSIHKVLMDHGSRVLCVTAKDKLRRLLAHGGVPATSAEKAHECPLPAYGIEDVVSLVGRKNPGPYEWDMSHYAMEIGLAVSSDVGALDLLYVSTTDFVQHAERPGGPTIFSGCVRFDTSCASRMKNGMPPKWSPWKCVTTMVSTALRSIPRCLSATREVAPQSINAFTLAPVRWKQVLKRPPEPKASPHPMNCRRMLL